MMNVSTAGQGPCDGSLWQSHRLWSLWDMLKFCTAPFYKVTAALQQTRGMVDNWGDAQKRRVLGPNDRNGWITQIRELKESLIILDSRSTLMAVDELIAHLENHARPLSYGELSGYFSATDEVLKRELSAVTLLVLERRYWDYYEPKAPVFGQDVANKFSSVLFEIEEAAKCLALGRSTAGAFHAMRCLEAGIRALSRCLQIADPTKAADRNWGAMLRVLKAGIDNKWPTSSNRLSGDGKLFDNSYAALAAMNNPWRNATMHLDQKYTDEEAHHIFEVVKGFMKLLASRMDENGDPKA